MLLQTLDNDIAVGVEHLVRLSKEAGRQLNTDKMRVQIDAMVASLNTAARTAQGWKVELRLHGYNGGWYEQRYGADSAITGGYFYHIMLRVTCAKVDSKKQDAQFQNIVSQADAKGRSQPGNPWQVTQVDGAEYMPLAPQDMGESISAEIGYAPVLMPSDWRDHFKHLYGLDPHINRVFRSIDNAIKTDFKSRVNSVLVGPPGCGKTDICQTWKGILGEEAVLEFDGTSTTMAGAQKELAEREELPRLLLVEEIEKAPEASLSWLLSILDMRGEIRKTTARASANILRETKMLCIATVNNWELFQRANAGALASRMSNKIFFQRPSRELLEKILIREVGRFDGRMEWIEPTLEFVERIGTTDPREVIAIMLCGRDALLDGSYQADMEATASPDQLEAWLPALPV